MFFQRSAIEQSYPLGRARATGQGSQILIAGPKAGLSTGLFHWCKHKSGPGAVPWGRAELSDSGTPSYVIFNARVCPVCLFVYLLKVQLALYGIMVRGACLLFRSISMAGMVYFFNKLLSIYVSYRCQKIRVV